MWRRAVAAAVTLAAMTTLSAHAASAGSHGELVLVGSRSASVTVRLIGAPSAGDGSTINAQTRGSYAGYLISDTHGQPLIGAVTVKGVGMAPGDAVPLAFSFATLKPGTYVVTLLTNGPSTVTIPLTGRTHLTVHPTRTAKVFARIIRSGETPSTAAGTPIGYSSTPLPAGRYTLASLTEFFTDSQGQAGVGDVCFTTLYQCQVGSDGNSSFNYIDPGSGESEGYFGASVSPADFGAGTNAVYDNADIATDSTHDGFVLLLG